MANGAATAASQKSGGVSEAELAGRDDNPTFEVGVGRYPRAAITPEIRRLSTVSNWRSAVTIALQWIIILSAGTLAVWSGHWAVYILAGLVIASRQQALGILVHDATHYLLFTNRTVNDIVSDLFCGFPVSISTTRYRSTHFVHHRFTNTEQDPDLVLQRQDPDWHWPKTRREALALFFRCVFALNLRGAAKAAMVWAPGSHMFDPITPAFPLRARVLFVLSSIVVWAVVIKAGLVVPALILWVLPALTVLNITNRMRATAEHVMMPGTHELNATRTVIPRAWERFFVAPLNINYHIEHHMFPSVPGRNLHRLHNVLMQDREYRDHAHITHSYFGLHEGVIAELIEPAAASSESRSPEPTA
jgi:fatty acid desaturase